MKHVDEGTLQRWLDGERGGLGPDEREAVEAHLAACPQCAARLAELEAQGRRVGELLAVSLGDDDAPDFEQVRARARGGTPAAARRHRWRPAVWAASIAVALGVGWMANELQRSTLATRPTAEAEPGPAASPPTRAAQADAASSDSGTGPAAEATPQLTATRAEDVVAGDVAEERVAADVAEAREDPADPSEVMADAPLEVAQPSTGAGTPVPAPAEPEADLPPVARPATPVIASARVEELPARAATETDTPAGAAVLRGRVLDEEGRPLSEAVVTVADAGVGALTQADGSFEIALSDLPADPGRVSLRAELIGYAPASQAVDVAGGGPAELRLRRQALSLDEVVVTGATAPTWRALPRAEAEAEAGFPVLTVPGLPVTRVEVGRVGTSVLLRVVQELDEGTLELILTRAGDEAAAEMAIGAGSDEGAVVHARRGDVVVRARAPLPVEELEALLRRIP